jgi:hypothetical protein
VTGAPARSVCSVKAFLKSASPNTSDLDISGQGLNPLTVTKPSEGVSWTAPTGLFLINRSSPAPSPGQQAYWVAKCVNGAFDPSVRTSPRSSAFDR